MTLGFEALADKNMGLFAITEAAAIKLNMRSVCVCARVYVLGAHIKCCFMCSQFPDSLQPLPSLPVRSSLCSLLMSKTPLSLFAQFLPTLFCVSVSRF